MKINWKIRIKHKSFWVSAISAVLLLTQAVAKAFGLDLDLSGVQEDLMSVLNALLLVLTVFGVPIDFTTEGVSDSERALTYEIPNCTTENSLSQAYAEDQRGEDDINS